MLSTKTSLMWYIFIPIIALFWHPQLPVFAPLQNLELVINEFLLLGIIPGTSVVITFNWIVAAFWILFFYWLTTKLTLNFSEKYRTLKRSNRINQISL